METTKIQLSPDELLLMQNSAWILTKNSVIDKMDRGFGDLLPRMQQQLKTATLWDDTFTAGTPKISRGEKYQGLPYVILDYPRNFGKENILAIRTLFWWGNYCSCTLHVKGDFQAVIAGRIAACRQYFANGNFYVSFSGNEWSHDLGDEDYRPLSSLREPELENLSGTAFLKIGARIDIGPWHEMEPRLLHVYNHLVTLLKA